MTSGGTGKGLRPLETIAWAEAHYRAHGSAVLADPRLAGLLQRTGEALDAADRALGETGIIALCRRCELEKGGSCCGAGIEETYDGPLLLVNLLLGRSLQKERPAPGACLYLGPKGCLLKARHALCVNYLCREITEAIPPEGLLDLREKEGRSLALVFELHDALLGFLRGR